MLDKVVGNFGGNLTDPGPGTSMWFSKCFFLLSVSLLLLPLEATYPLYAEHVYRKHIAKNLLKYGQFEDSVRIYPQNVGPSTTDKNKTNSTLEIYTEFLYSVDKNLMSPTTKYGEKLVNAVVERITLYNLWCKLPQSTDQDRLIVNAFSTEALPFFSAIKDCELMNIMSEILSDCKMVADVCILASKEPNLMVSRKVIDDFFDLINVQFSFVVEFCCSTFKEQLIVQRIYSLFLTKKTPLMNTYVRSLIFHLREMEIPLLLTTADTTNSDSFYSSVDFTTLMLRLQRQALKPFTTDRLPLIILENWDLSRLEIFTVFMNKLQFKLKSVDSYGRICSHLVHALRLSESLEHPNNDCINAARLSIYHLHFGMSNHAEVLFNKPWLRRLFGESVMKEYDSICKHLGYALEGPFKEFNVQYISNITHPFSTYLHATEATFSPVPTFMLMNLSRICNTVDPSFSISLMKQIQRLIDRFIVVIYELLQTFDYVRLGRYIPSVQFKFQPLYSILMTLARSQSMLSVIHSKSGLHTRMTVQCTSAHIKDTLAMYYVVARSGDLYTIHDEKGSSDLTFFRQLLLQPIIIGDKLLNGHSLYPEESQRSLKHILKYIYKHRSLMITMGAWDGSAEALLNQYGPHIHKYA